jgi:hypothetical protein
MVRVAARLLGMSSEDRLEEIKARHAIHDGAELRTQLVRDTDWLIGQVERGREEVLKLDTEIERLEKALSEVDNLASGAVRFGRQVRVQAQTALGWDHDVG